MKDILAVAFVSFRKRAPLRRVLKRGCLLTLGLLIYLLGRPGPAFGQANAPARSPISPSLNALLDELTRRGTELTAPDPRAPFAPRRPFDPDPSRVLQGQFLVRVAAIRSRLGDAKGALKIADQIAGPFWQQSARAEAAETLDRTGETNEATRIRATLSEYTVLETLATYPTAAAHESLQAGRLDEARAHLDRGLALAGTNWLFMRGDILFGFGRALFETGHTNEALSTLARAVDLTRPLLDKAQGNVPWMRLRDTAQLQAQMREMRAALATAELIRDPEQWSVAYLLVQREQIAQGDVEGARRTFDQLVKAIENQTNFTSVSPLLQSHGLFELGVRLAKDGRADETRQFMADALRRMRAAAKGQETEILNRLETQITMAVVYGLIEGKHFAEAAKEISSSRDEPFHNQLETRLEAARVEAGEPSLVPASADVSSPGAVARTAARARKLAQIGQFTEAFKLAEPLPARDARSVFGTVVTTAISSNDLARAGQVLKKFPLAEPQGQWDDGGIGFKTSLLEQLAKAQVERKLTNEARSTFREAIALCGKSQNQNLQTHVHALIPRLAELGDAEGALAALAAQKVSLSALYVGAPTGEALAHSLGMPAAISIARAQKDQNLELYLLLGVAEETSRKRD